MGLMFSTFMMTTWEAGTIIAVVAGVVGFFTVLRGQAFAAHALPNGSFAGAAAATLLNANIIAGVGVFAILGALATNLLGRRARTDVATALTIVTMLGLGALFLSMSREYAPAVYSLLFGELLGVGNEQVGATALIGAISVAAILVLQRPLLLTAVAPDMGEARGVNPRLIDLAFLLIIALMTTVAVPVVGALLTFSLLIAPPAAANSFTSRPWLAMVLSVVIAVLTIWLAIGLAYLNNLPIGFLVGGLGAVAYAVGRGWVIFGGRFRRKTVKTVLRST